VKSKVLLGNPVALSVHLLVFGLGLVGSVAPVGMDVKSTLCMVVSLLLNTMVVPGATVMVLGWKFRSREATPGGMLMTTVAALLVDLLVDVVLLLVGVVLVLVVVFRVEVVDVELDVGMVELAAAVVVLVVVGVTMDELDVVVELGGV
jgi:hypothetical protein